MLLSTVKEYRMCLPKMKIAAIYVNVLHSGVSKSKKDLKANRWMFITETFRCSVLNYCHCLSKRLCTPLCSLDFKHETLDHFE